MSSVSWAIRRRFSGRHAGDRAHVVEPVGELDHQDPEVLGHCHQHLAHGGCLLRLARVELDPLELGDTVDQPRHLGAEVLLDVGQRDLGVLHRIVQQGRRQRHVVEPDVGHDRFHRQRVVDVALTARPGLRVVCLGSHVVGAIDDVDARLGMTSPVHGEQRCQLGRRRRLVVASPRENAIDPSTSRHHQ